MAIAYTIPWDKESLKAPDVVFGRDLALERLPRAVARTVDPAIVLLADAGCGKSAIVRHWARRVLQGDVPLLAGYTLHQLDITGILTDIVLGKIGTAAVEGALQEVSRLEKAILIVD